MRPANIETILCVGSNCGERKRNVELALNWLSGILRDFRHSHIYATPDSHGGKREYMNAVCTGKCDLSMERLNALCKEFEISLGRDSAAREVGDVPVDVDIVVYNGKIVRERDFGSEFFIIGYRDMGL